MPAPFYLSCRMKKLCIGFLSIIIALLAVFSVLPLSSGVAFASTSVYSDVLDDLQADENFNAEDYPVNNSDYGLYLLTVAESIDDELFVYVYQPCVQKDFRATSISMSLTITDFNSSITPHIYYLEYLNSENSLYKYRVVNFTVSESEIRYYEIFSIYRSFDDSIDPLPSGSNQTVNERAFNVGKRFTCGIINGNYYIACKEVQTVDITDMFVGFLRYENSVERSYFYVPDEDPVDSHFVAFSTTNSIDKVLEATVFYQEQDYVWHIDYFPDGYFGDIEDNYVELSYTDSASFTSSGWWNYGTYEWGRIQTVDEMITGEDHEKIYHCGLFNVRTYSVLSEDAIEDLHNYQYVLRFKETSWLQQRNVQGLYLDRRVIISNVSILRLKYTYDGVVYNLGTVSNKQTGSNDPLNISETLVELSEQFKEFLQWLLLILGIVLGCIILYFLAPVIKFIFKIIIAPFKWIFGRTAKGRQKNKGKKQR